MSVRRTNPLDVANVNKNIQLCKKRGQKYKKLMKSEERRVKNLIEYVAKHKTQPPQSPQRVALSNAPKGGREQNQPFLVPSPLGRDREGLISPPSGESEGAAFSFTSPSNKSRTSVLFLFRQRGGVREGCIIAYIYNMKVRG